MIVECKDVKRIKKESIVSLFIAFLAILEVILCVLDPFLDHFSLYICITGNIFLINNPRGSGYYVANIYLRGSVDHSFQRNFEGYKMVLFLKIGQKISRTPPPLSP